MALLDSLLTQFRATLPHGAVVAELLTVQEGQFAVRALVQVGGQTLASGMATAPHIEQAEDRAKERALQAFGISSTGAAGAPNSTPVPATAARFSPPPSPQVTSAVTPADSYSGSSAARLDPVPTEADSLPVADFYSHMTLAAQADADEVPPPLPPMQRASDLLPPKPTAEPSAADPATARASEKPKRPEPTAEEPSAATAIPESVDLSDVIAQTDIELRRLGWTASMGRTYLEQAYNKRSRAELSELELYEFLSYLTSQPTPETAPN